MSVVEHHTVALDDVRMHYAMCGSGDPVVLLHGWPQTSAAWKRVMAALAERHTVIAPDLRGMGASSKPDAGYDTDTVASDVRQLVDHLGLDSIFLVGHDWGGATAYSFAAQHPERVRRLAIFEMVLPGFGIMEGAMVPQAHGQYLWHMGFQSVPDVPLMLLTGREEQYLNLIFQHYAYDPSAVAPERMRHYVKAMQAVGALRGGLGYYRDYFTSAAQNELHRQTKLTMPVLAMAGEACLGPLTEQCLQLAAEDVCGGVIERCGHWVAEERPDFVAAQLLGFFSSG